jgi:DNA-binding MarR family transcriptional regulator
MPSALAQRDVGYQTNRLARLLRQRLARELEPTGLTPAQAAVLLAVAELDTPSVGAVADRLGIDRPTMSGIVDRLVRDGWARLSPNPDDGRSRLLGLSRRAQRALPTLRRASAAASRLPGMTAVEAVRLAQLLERAATALEDACETGSVACASPEVRG